MRVWAMTRRRGRWLTATLGCGVVLAPAALAATASAATLTVDKACYVDHYTAKTIAAAMMHVSGSGYTPGGLVDITSPQGVFATTTAAPDGTISAAVKAPTPFFAKPASEPFALQATDETSGTQGGVFSKVTYLDVATRPARAKPSTKVTWYFSGWTPGRYIYSHYLHRGREVARARFGRAKGVCGLLRVRARFFPGGHQRYKTYPLQFDQKRRYSRRTRPRLTTTLRLFAF